jgi:hypothetical protein
MDDTYAFARLGHRSALVCGAGAIGYGVITVAIAITAPAAFTWEGYQKFAAEYSRWPTMAAIVPPFVVTVAFPALVLAMYAAAPPARRPLALLALLFACVYTAVLGAAYWLQLTTVPWNVVRGATDGIEPWVIWNPASFFWSLETFAYFAMGLGCTFAANAFDDATMPRRLRRCLAAMGILGVYFLSTSAKDVLFDPAPDAGWVTVWSLSAAFAWIALFGYVSFALARWFAGLKRPAPADAGAATIREVSPWHPT